MTLPLVGDIVGIDNWPGKQMHSHNYRIAQPFTNQVQALYKIHA
jgi:cation diffusion facilitator CzcD-associated flavoprotein CzcO